MKKIIIEGSNSLSGTIKIGGAKNSLVALIPAAILSEGEITINNVPNILDKVSLLEILNLLEINVKEDNQTLIINNKNIKNKLINNKLSKKLRASYYFMGALLARFGFVEIYMPGGCKIGQRPIDLHLDAFEEMGINIKVEGEKYTLDGKNMHGADINLKFPSVGATINVMLAAVKAKGKTIIENAAKEVEIINIGEFLNKMGAKISGLGTGKIVINGVNKLASAEISVIPDRIESGTYVILGALLGKNFTVDGFIPEYNQALLKNLEMMNVEYKIDGHKIEISKDNDISPLDITTGVYPAFPTDLGQPMQILLTQAKGQSFFEETIYETRMMHIQYLNKMGANIINTNMTATINGPVKLKGAKLSADDLRGGAALVLAGLIAEGTTEIENADFILRGYENIINKLSKVGAKIKIEEI